MTKKGIKIKKQSGIILVLLVSIIFLLSIGYSISQSQYIQFEPPVFNEPTAIIPPTATRLAKCVSYPPVEKESQIRTATPNLGEKGNGLFAVTVTPRPINNIIDLSPKSDAIDKAVVTIFRCNGTFDQYVVGPDIKIPDDLPLSEGDTIYSFMPLGLHPMDPGLPTEITNNPSLTKTPIETKLPFVQPTIVPYTAPWNSSTNSFDKKISTDSPYPGP